MLISGKSFIFSKGDFFRVYKCEFLSQFFEVEMSPDEVEIYSKSTNYTVEHKAREEARKLEYDIFKHLTTLSTGSILLSATFLEKVFPHPNWKLLIAVAFLAFITSILASLMMMLLLADSVLALGTLHKDDNDSKFFDSGIAFAAGGFILGLVALAIFAFKNIVF